MSSCGKILAKEVVSESPSEKEDCEITLHIGIFFDGCESSSITSKIALNYACETCEKHRYYTLVINDCEVPTFLELIDIDGMEKYGLRLGNVLYDVFKSLSDILSGYLSYASNLTIEIDTFCIEEGFFAASMFCESIKPGCYDEMPPFGEYAIADISGGDILEDFRMRGAKIILNSFTTFQIQSHNDSIGLSTETRYNNSCKKNNGSSKKQGEYEDVFHGLKCNDVTESEEHDDSESILFDQDKLVFKIKISKERYPGTFSKLLTAVEWMENTALMCDIVAVTTGVTGVGLLVTVPCEIVSMGLSGISSIICFGMGAMANIDGDKSLANEYKFRGTMNAIGAVPFGTIIGKVGKGVKFSTKKTSISLVEETSKVSKNNVIDFPKKGNPSLRSIAKNPKPDVSSVTNIEKAAMASEKRAMFKVIQGGLSQGQYLKVANGSMEIFVPDFSSRSFNVVFNSIESFGQHNYLFTNSHLYSGVKAISKAWWDQTVNSTRQTDELKVEPIEKTSATNDNIMDFNGDSGRQAIIADLLELGKRFLAMLRFEYLIKSGLINKEPFDAVKRMLEIILNRSLDNKEVWEAIKIFSKET